MEEHVLERISAMEYSISMLNKRVDSLMDTIERVAASNFIDHTMIETLTDALESGRHRSGAISKRNGASASIRGFSKPRKSIASAAACDRIMDAYRGPDRSQFGQWIEKSHDLFLAGQPRESIRFPETGAGTRSRKYRTRIAAGRGLLPDARPTATRCGA